MLLFVVLALALSPAVAGGAEQTVEQQIAQAVQPLPEHLRDGAMVIRYAEPGKRTVLRQGTNNLLCRADTPAPGVFVRCHHKDHDALFTRLEELMGSGKSEKEMLEIIADEVKAGQIKVGAGYVEYILSGGLLGEGLLPLMTVFIPNATAESTGLSTEPSSYRPWLMLPGHPAAHVMIPGK